MPTRLNQVSTSGSQVFYSLLVTFQTLICSIAGLNLSFVCQFCEINNKAISANMQVAKQILPRPQSKEQAMSYQSNCQEFF